LTLRQQDDELLPAPAAQLVERSAQFGIGDLCDPLQHRHEVPSVARPRRRSPRRLRRKDRRRHHHSRYRTGKAAEGEIVAVGPGARDDSGKVQPLDVKAGDRVLFGKWSGTEVKIDGEDLLIMKESDIMGVLDREKAEGRLNPLSAIPDARQQLGQIKTEGVSNGC
jgi:co-chaperonin GroES (HSP10)